MATGSFLFVKPSDPNGEIGTAYSGESPQYTYDRASWEWLLERALRRTLIPWALTKSHSREILSGHEGQYSMHRWGSYGASYPAGVIPLEYDHGVSPGANGKKTDANLSEYDRNKTLPWSWNSSNGTPTYSSVIVSYGIVDLEDTVARLPFSIEWLHPKWSPSRLDAWDLTADTTETTNGVPNPGASNTYNWTWKTTVKHNPFTIPGDVPFKCLSHMRTDDYPVTVSITNDDIESGEVSVETAHTPWSAPRTPDGGSIIDFQETEVRSASSGAAHGAGWSLSEFYVKYKHGLDYSESTGTGAYDRGEKTSESYKASDSTLGCLVDIPDKDSENIMVQQMGDEAGFVHEVNWGDDKQPTWWHANDFPKGLDSVLSSRLKDQLKALCTKCQPAIPPAIPAFFEKFPEGAYSPKWDHTLSVLRSFSSMYPTAWMRHLALACTPFDMSARLDAMTTTVHRVPTIFAKTRTVTTTHSYKRSDGAGKDYSGPYGSWETSDYRYEVTVEGTSANPIPAGDDLTSMSGHTEREGKSTINDIVYGSFYTEKSKTTYEESFKSTNDFIVCLRSTANTKLSTKTTTKNSSTINRSDYDSPSISETEASSGELPDSYDPDPDDLLFPDWVLPWIETAELFASIESRLGRYGSAAYNTHTHKEVFQDRLGEKYISYSGNGSGTRTHKVNRKIVSLGKMDMSTGRFPAIDAAKILSEVDPDPTEPSGGHDGNSDVITTEDRRYEDDSLVWYGVYITTTDVKGSVGNYRSRSVSYYVVVKWKFDREDPETLETKVPLADLYRKLADAEKALSDKRRELSDAQSALTDAESYLQSAKAALDIAQKRLSNPDGAEAELLAEARAALDRANQELSAAQAEKSAAQEEESAAESDMQSAKSSLQSAQAAYDAAVASGTGVEAAQAALESAYTVYYKAVDEYGKASGKLFDAEARETNAQQAADSAREYYETLHDNIMDILKKAVDDAQAAVNEATSMVSKWKTKVKEIEGEIPGLEDKVEDARQAIRDAGGNA